LYRGSRKGRDAHSRHRIGHRGLFNLRVRLRSVLQIPLIAMRRAGCDSLQGIELPALIRIKPAGRLPDTALKTESDNAPFLS
jgi:hypothetical protein